MNDGDIGRTSKNGKARIAVKAEDRKIGNPDALPRLNGGTLSVVASFGGNTSKGRIIFAGKMASQPSET